MRESVIVLATFKELNHIEASLGAADLSLALENDETRESKELIEEHDWKGVRTDVGGAGGDGDWKAERGKK
ncbi:hypothetical protein SLEP1_g7972 [Rubroshorea leprosula]|uniref:Uncharacterized protein n=1 Tax=Rubroshorea leprosula TaxID=152421 RepID=A0AAV5IA15_9ROSI|nr:hypothetical protein SLEP1_g7972 [Rubroshorea leprosula]